MVRANSLKKLVPLRLKLFLSQKFSLLRRLVVGKNTKALLVESKNGLLLVGVEDMQVGRKLSSEGAYAAEELDRLLPIISPHSGVLIVGAHIGALAIPLAKSCRSVTAIEANPESFRLLELNLALNGCANIRALNLAASDKHESLKFVVSRANSGGSKRLPVSRDYKYFYDRPEVIDVTAAPLDDVFPDASFELVVMDIEGSEYFALKGMPKLLSRARTLAVEFLPHHLRNVAGVSPADFVDQLYPYFDRLYIPSKNLSVQKSDFHSTLSSMFDHDEGEEALILSKEK